MGRNGVSVGDQLVVSSVVCKVRKGGDKGVREVCEHEAYPRSYLFMNDKPSFEL